MPSTKRAFELARATTPRYCDHCGSMNIWSDRGAALDLTGRKMTMAPIWECGVCFGVTLLTARAARRLVALDRKPKFIHRFRKNVVDTRALVG